MRFREGVYSFDELRRWSLMAFGVDLVARLVANAEAAKKASQR